MQSPVQHGPKRTSDRRVSLATLSAHLGLSAAAISRVLNGAPAARSIPQTTQDRIFQAARELNYRPNILARSLRRGHSMTMGVLVPEIAEGYTALVLAGLEEALQQAGYFYLLISHHHRAEVIERSIATMTERAVDGLIAIDTALPPHVELPTATVSGPNRFEGQLSVALNQVLAAELAIGHLVELGHTEIAFIKGQEFSSDTAVRWSSIEHAAAAHGLTINPALVVQMREDEATHKPGFRAAQQLLAAETPFSALFAFNDISAIGAVKALRDAGLQIPGDVSVIGFDDIQSAAYQNPSLTTVRQPLRDMGRLAAESLLRRIGSGAESAVTEHLEVRPELVIRESTAPPAGMSTRAR